MSQQYDDFFKILEKIDNLTYRLKFSNHWRIHSVLFVAQLKFVFSSTNFFFNRSRSNQSNFVFVEKNTNQIKLWKIDKFINKRQIKRRDDECFVKWKNWNSQYNEWRNLLKFDDVQNFVQNYENALRFTIFLSNCMHKFFMISSIKIIISSKFFDFKKFFVVVSLIKKSFTTISLTSTFVNQLSTKQKFAIVISRKSDTTTSLIFDIEAFVLIRKSITIELITFSITSSIIAIDILIRRFHRFQKWKKKN